jgi:transposase
MGDIRMSRKERRRLEVFSRVKEGQITQAKASGFLGLSYRHTKRVYKRYTEEGDRGLPHRARGRPSNRRMAEEIRRGILEVYKNRYGDFGPTLAAEHLEKRDGYRISPETLRQWLLKEGLWKKQRRRKKHRRWRERKAYAGELVQMDGSHHDWFEGRREKAVLMVMVDDATSRTYARFFEGETARAAFETFGRYTGLYGLPRALYVDRDSIYRCEREATVEEELKNTGPLTQFGRAMDHLGVALIPAYSAPAKGRVERTNGTLQDRLIKEMRLEGMGTIEEANRFLEERFLPAYNTRFSVSPKREADLHRPVHRNVKLDEILCFEQKRVVLNDWTVRWRNRFFQLSKRNESLGLTGRRITVREKLSGEIQLVYRGLKLAFRELPARPERASRTVRRKRRNPPKPPADHPWRRPFLGGRRIA